MFHGDARHAIARLDDVDQIVAAPFRKYLRKSEENLRLPKRIYSCKVGQASACQSERSSDLDFGHFQLS
jgi:hypothetical protein